MLFPFMATSEDNEQVTTSNTYKEYDFDFEKCVLTGKIVEGKEAVKVWIYKALMSKRYIHDIYSWDYGHDLEELIGQGYDKGFIESEVERRIKDCLSVNEKIEGCTGFDISFVNDKLNVSFTANTVFGEVAINV
nr:DUF2634 domain-containing protein [uncultured Cellulosilyticum sp.]